MTENVTFTMAKAGDKLRVSYRLENKGSQPLQVLDTQLEQVKDQLWKHSKVQRWQQQGDTVEIIVALPGGSGVSPPRGFFVAVPPGGSSEGTRELPYPLTDMSGKPLTGVKQVTFAIEVLDGAPADTIKLPTENGTVEIPDGPETRLARAAGPQPLP